GAEPAVGVNRLCSGLGLVEVALHHVRAAREDLAVLRDSYLHPFDRWTDGAEPEVIRRVDGDHRRSLGEAVPLEDHQAGRVEELVDLRCEWRTAGNEVLHAAAGALLQLGEDETVCDAVLQREKPEWLAA